LVANIGMNINQYENTKSRFQLPGDLLPMVFSLSLEKNRSWYTDHADGTAAKRSVKKRKKSVRSVKSVYKRVKNLDFEKTMVCCQ